MLKPHETHFVGQVNQKALIKKDGKFLLMQYPKTGGPQHPNKKVWGKWDMPGGRLNEGEAVLAGLTREVFEEIGAEIVADKILYTGTFTNFGDQRNFFVIYEASLKNPTENFKHNDGEVEAAEWFTPDEILNLPIIYPEYFEALKIIFAPQK
ncbi:MAG: NUDIX hydrolase [Patescibacteria group bacterium]